MKILTIAIPSYNSEAYVHKAVESALVGGNEVEILIVNDGSTDQTAAIAMEYEKQYPHIIRVINQENGGHGSAVNTGIREATGKYFKVLDSDDWLEEEAFKAMLTTMKNQEAQGFSLDMYIANYVYERVAEGKQKTINYIGVLPAERTFSWDEIGHFAASQFILMHSVIYKTQLLRECKLELPKHTFYVDNLFVYYPFPNVKSIYYLNVDLYRYFIGREDQSVNERNMMNRIDQQIRVTKQMIEKNRLHEVKSKKLRGYMIKYISIMMTICTVFLVKRGSKEDIQKKEELWKYLKNHDIQLYYMVRKTPLGRASQLQGRVGHRLIKTAYRISRKMIGFN